MQRAKINLDYRKGYIAGMTDGDGTFRMPVYGKKSRESPWYWRVALMDIIILKQLRNHLKYCGVRLFIQDYKIKPIWMYRIETRRRNVLNKIYEICHSEQTKEFKRGYFGRYK